MQEVLTLMHVQYPVSSNSLKQQKKRLEVHCQDRKIDCMRTYCILVGAYFHINGHKAFRRNYRMFIFVMCLPNTMPPCFSCIYFLHLQGHLTMAENCVPCRAVRRTCQSLPASLVWTCLITLLASTCFVHFAYFNVSQFSQPHCHCQAKGCRQESTGVWKVVRRLEVPVECHCFITTSTCYDCLLKI